MSNFDLSLNNITLIYFNYTPYPQVQEGLLQRYKMKRFTTSIAHNVSTVVHPVDTGRKLNVLHPVSVYALCRGMLNVYVGPRHNSEISMNKCLFTDTTAMSIHAGPMKP